MGCILLEVKYRAHIKRFSTWAQHLMWGLPTRHLMCTYRRAVSTCPPFFSYGPYQKYTLFQPIKYKIHTYMHIRNFRLELKRIISVPEIRQVIISNIILHPAGKRLLIQTRDSILRMMDLYTTAIIQWFRVSILITRSHLSWEIQMLPLIGRCKQQSTNRMCIKSLW